MVTTDLNLQINEAHLGEIDQAELMPIIIFLKMFMLVQVLRGPSRSVTEMSRGKVVPENHKPVEPQPIIILIVVEIEM